MGTVVEFHNLTFQIQKIFASQFTMISLKAFHQSEFLMALIKKVLEGINKSLEIFHADTELY